MRPITVEVRLYGVLRDYYAHPDQVSHWPFTVVAPATTTVADVIVQLAIPAELVAGVAVNGSTADFQTSLHEGDQVRLFPPSAGG